MSKQSLASPTNSVCGFGRVGFFDPAKVRVLARLNGAVLIKSAALRCWAEPVFGQPIAANASNFAAAYRQLTQILLADAHKPSRH